MAKKIKIADQEFIDQLVAENRSETQIDEILAMEGLRRPSGYGKSLARSALGQGLALGFGDEIEAGIKTGFGFAGDYDKTRDQIRDDLLAWQEENPGVAITSEIAGGLLTGVIGGGKVLGMKALQSAPGWIKAAGLGAAEGGVAGVGHATDENIEGGLKGAGIGAVAGGVAHPIMKYGAGLLPKGHAGQKVRQSLEEAGYKDADEAIGAMQGGDIIADLGIMPKTNFRAAGTHSGRGKTAATDAMVARNAGQAEEIDDVISQAAQTRKSPQQYIDDISRMQSEEGNILYGKAMAVPVQPTRSVLSVLDTRAGKKAFEDAVEDYKIELPKMPPLSADPEDINDLNFWDFFQRRMRSASDSAAASQNKREASMLNLQRKVITDTFDHQTGGLWFEARKAWGASAGAKKAVEEGRKVFTKSQASPLDTIDKIKRFDKDQKRAFLVGVMGEVKDRVFRRPDAANMAKGILNKKNTRDKIKAAFGDDTNGYDEFISEIQRISNQGETASLYLQGSKTAPMLMEREGLQEGVGSGIGDVLQGDVVAGSKKLLSGAGMNVLDRASAGKMVDAYLKSGPEAQRYMQQIYQGGQLSNNSAAFGAYAPNLMHPFTSPEPDPVGDILRDAGIEPQQ